MENSNQFSRRKFISTLSIGSISTAVAGSLPLSSEAMPGPENSTESPPNITDTNVHLFQWPFRNLKYDKTSLLVEKMRKHRITQAWAGNYEAIFSKSIDITNSRLVKECRENGRGMLIPFGTVNPAWPDWQEDLRRCHEVHKMPGIRVYPQYQEFNLNSPDFASLVEEATKRNMIVQIVGDIEDPRVYHPVIVTKEIKFEPIVDVMKKVPGARVQLLGWNLYVDGELLKKLVNETDILLDISWLESVGALGRWIEGNSWYGAQTPVPVERFLFGSNAPIFPVEASAIKLFEAPLTLQQMQAVMNGNATRFFKQVKPNV